MEYQPVEVPVRQIEWMRAWNALKVLVADPTRTEQVFEITDALAGASFERLFLKFANHPDGQRLLAERPSLLAVLSDRDALHALPVGSFGRAYAEFMECGNLTADGLVEADEMVVRDDKRIDEPNRRYYGDRLRDMHDLWHVLTGYGRDEAGEAANLAFTLAQIPNKGIALIVAAAAFLGTTEWRLGWPRYLYRAWRRGRRAAMLAVAPYESLLDRPLDEVRRALNIEPAEVAHPGGIIVATMDDVSPGIGTRLGGAH
jgi:ubiquinone biosynthesis protein COQ4